MRIACIGGGPAGLYFSILMKQADPAHDITVYERNRPDDTFGWGVVFSDATLGNFSEADPESYAEITRSFHHHTAQHLANNHFNVLVVDLTPCKRYTSWTSSTM